MVMAILDFLAEVSVGSRCQGKATHSLEITSPLELSFSYLFVKREKMQNRISRQISNGLKLKPEDEDGNGDQSVSEEGADAHHVDQGVEFCDHCENSSQRARNKCGRERCFKFRVNGGQKTKQQSVLGHGVDYARHRHHSSH